MDTVRRSCMLINSWRQRVKVSQARFNVMLNFTAIDHVLNCFNSAELYFYFQNLFFFVTNSYYSLQLYCMLCSCKIT